MTNCKSCEEKDRRIKLLRKQKAHCLKEYAEAQKEIERLQRTKKLSQRCIKIADLQTKLLLEKSEKEIKRLLKIINGLNIVNQRED